MAEVSGRDINGCHGAIAAVVARMAVAPTIATNAIARTVRDARQLLLAVAAAEARVAAAAPAVVAMEPGELEC